MKGNYVIWDTKTGINDGAYVNLETAMHRYKSMSEETPGAWVVAQVIHGPQLADDKFHANINFDISIAKAENDACASLCNRMMLDGNKSYKEGFFRACEAIKSDILKRNNHGF